MAVNESDGEDEQDADEEEDSSGRRRRRILSSSKSENEGDEDKTTSIGQRNASSVQRLYFHRRIYEVLRSA